MERSSSGDGRRRFRAGALGVIAAYRLAAVGSGPCPSPAFSSTPALRQLHSLDYEGAGLAEERLLAQRRALAWASCLHPRVGHGSAAGALPVDVVRLVTELGPGRVLRNAAVEEAGLAAAFGMMQGLGA